jgi:hypothetical protein
MIDVLMLTYNDWANTGFRFARMLRENLGLNVIQFKGIQHRFRYPKQANIHPDITRGRVLSNNPIIVEVKRGEITKLMEDAKVIHFTASTIIEAGTRADQANKIIQHGGTTYRSQPDRVNEVCNGFADAAIIQCPDLFGLGAFNENLIYYPVDTDYIKPDDYRRKHSGRLTVGHWPSSPESKGTADILRIVAEYDKLIDYVGVTDIEPHNLPWDAHLERVRSVDVLIETFKPTLWGKGFGEWGNQCLEAAAMGKIVITNSVNEDIYRREYGECPLLIANNEAQLRYQLDKLSWMTDDDLIDLKAMHRDWAVEKHSLTATAERLWDRVYKPLNVF